ncbi:MAG: MerR family DNA-binding protein [Acidobacteriota bacterium]
MKETGLLMGEVAKQAGVNRETIRYYERIGLLRTPLRTHSGYRLYPFDVVAQARFIKRAQELGFSLKEISELLSLRVDPDTNCSEVRRRAEVKIADIEEKMQALQRMKKALTKLVASCRGRGPTSECPILEALNSAWRKNNANS